VKARVSAKVDATMDESIIDKISRERERERESLDVIRINVGTAVTLVTPTFQRAVVNFETGT